MVAKSQPGITALPKDAYRPGPAALVGIDFQQAFGNGAWEHVPHAQGAVDKFREVATAWRSVGGRVIYVHTTYFPDDVLFAVEGVGVSGAPHALAEGGFGASFYPGLVEPEDVVIRKLGFSAITGSSLLEVLHKLGCGTVILGGLTTPYCVQTTADDLNASGLKVAVISDACASQGIGQYTPEQAHDFAIERISYLIGNVIESSELLSNLK